MIDDTAAVDSREPDEVFDTIVVTCGGTVLPVVGAGWMLVLEASPPSLPLPFVHFGPLQPLQPLLGHGRSS